MNELDQTGRDPSTHPPRTVVVQVAARPGDLPSLRLVAGDLAARADFDLDSVADLRMAVDEAAAELLPHASDGARITCTFVVNADSMAVTVTVPSQPGAALHRDTFGWRVLSTLVDTAEPLDGDDDAGPRLGIALAKNRLPGTDALLR